MKFDVQKHYEQSKKNYLKLAEQGAEAHIAYYKEKYPKYYNELIKKY